MSFSSRFTAVAASALLALCGVAQAQDSSSSSSSSSNIPAPGAMQREKAPTLVDPAGPAISLVSAEPVFLMAASLNACGYDDGLEQSAPERTRVRTEINNALSKSEVARNDRDKLCLYVAQHRMTGSQRDIAQYISLALYLSPPPELETVDELAEMPPDATQVVEVLPLLRAFVKDVDLHGIWLAVHRTYDEEIARVHDSLYKTIDSAQTYLRMPYDSYSGRRFTIVVEPLLSPNVVNARIYGTDYVVVLSPSNGAVPLTDVRHTYLHYLIEPLLFARANAIDRAQPILKEIREAPLDFRYRSDTVPLTIECLIKAIEARTMDSGIPDYRIPAGIDRSQLPRYEHERQLVQQKQESVRQAAVHHAMAQGFVLTQYFYEQLIQFEHQPASLNDTIGEMVYSMDIDQQVHRARQIEFDKEADVDVLTRPKPRKLEGLDLAEARLQAGDIAGASSIARQFVQPKQTSLQATADSARANFVLARAAAMTGRPEEAIDRFQATLATTKEPRLIAWSHIYLGRMLDLDCKRDQAVSEYKLALEKRDGQMDTRLAAERGVKAAYAVKGHSCEQDDADEEDAPAQKDVKPAAPKGSGAVSGSGSAASKPQ